MKTEEQIIRAAGRLLKDPKNRCTKAYARTKWRKPVETDSPKACKFCLLGAVAKVGNYSPGAFPVSVLAKLQNILGLGPPSSPWDHGDVVNAWDKGSPNHQTEIAKAMANYREPAPAVD